MGDEQPPLPPPKPSQQEPQPTGDFAGFRGAPPAPRPPPPPPPPPALSAAECAAARSRDSVAWKRFADASAAAAAAASGGSGALGEGDVPWPCLGDDEPLPGHAGLEPLARKVAVRQLQLRWHVDKFTQKHGRRLGPSEKEAVLRRVVAVSQALNAIEQP